MRVSDSITIYTASATNGLSESPHKKGDASGAEKSDGAETKQNTGKTEALTPAEQSQVASLQTRDAQVRAHEAAHIAAGSGVVSGGASFSYQRGPDGRLYAVGGEVPIATSGGDTPEETIATAQKIRTAALAPADPSPQDYKVAATASLMEARARQELAVERREESIAIYRENQEESSK